MAGALLRSGTLQEFRALGVDGQPVYGAARQLREAVRLRLGADAANCLALPQPSENGERLDWYAPVEGDVVPWSAATDDERADAWAQLDRLHARLRETVGGMHAAAAADKNQDPREKQVFARLLDKSLSFPGSEHVYLVNGTPVVTFWGFGDRDGNDVDPLLSLRPPLPVPAAALPVAAAAAPPVIPVTPVIPVLVERRVRPWWWWLLWLLLLLLLLWLLLFALRACAPQVRLPFGLGAPDLPGFPATAVRVVEVEPAIIGGGVVDPVGGAGGVVPGAGMAAPDAAAPVAAAPDAAGADAAMPPPAPDSAAGGNQNAPPELNTEPDAGSQQPPPQLAIPPEALADGSTGFLNGRWRAGAGIQDAQTGKPLRLDYTFSDGAGQVRVERGDGVMCSGQVNAAMQDGQLALTSPEAARCDDGGSYRLPEVQCKPGAQATADCTGQYQNQQFPVMMRQAGS